MDTQEVYGVTTAQVRALRREAAEEGDDLQVSLCDRALACAEDDHHSEEQEIAWQDCAEAVSAGQG